MRIGANNSLRSLKESNQKDVSQGNSNKWGPLNAMTRAPFLVWPNATVSYTMDASISKLTKDCSMSMGGKMITLKFIKFIKFYIVYYSPVV